MPAHVGDSVHPIFAQRAELSVELHAKVEHRRVGANDNVLSIYVGHSGHAVNGDVVVARRELFERILAFPRSDRRLLSLRFVYCEPER